MAVIVAALAGGVLGWLMVPAAARIMSTHDQGKFMSAQAIPRSWRVVSAVAGALYFGSTLAVYGLSVAAIFVCLLGLVLLVASLIDATLSIIPNQLVSVGVAVWLLYIAVLFAMGSDQAIGAALSGLLAAVVIGVLLLVLSLLMDALLHKSSLGGGDIKLFAMVSLYLGLAVSLLNLILACLFGLVFALMRKGDKGTGPLSPFPFAPAISLATWCSILFGSALIGVYLGFF